MVIVIAMYINKYTSKATRPSPECVVQPISIYPTCPIELYANSRLILFWEIAENVPTSKEAIHENTSNDEQLVNATSS